LSKRFTEARPPPNPEDLPADLRKQMEEPVPTKMTDLEMAALNGELELIPSTDEVVKITKDDKIVKEKVDVEASIQQRALEAIQQLNSDFSARQVLQLAEYAKKDFYDIEFDNGTTRRFKREPLNEDHGEQMKDLQIELEGKERLAVEGKEISKRELRILRTKQIKLGREWYLRDAQTGKPMTEEEAKHITPAGDLENIVDSCIYRTVHDIVDPKV
jgi:hypothetical protein